MQLAQPPPQKKVGPPLANPAYAHVNVICLMFELCLKFWMLANIHYLLGRIIIVTIIIVIRVSVSWLHVILAVAWSRISKVCGLEFGISKNQWKYVFFIQKNVDFTVMPLFSKRKYMLCFSIFSVGPVWPLWAYPRLPQRVDCCMHLPIAQYGIIKTVLNYLHYIANSDGGLTEEKNI